MRRVVTHAFAIALCSACEQPRRGEPPPSSQPQPPRPGATVRNESGIAIADTVYTEVTTCKDLERHAAALEEIGLAGADLARPVSCVPADFDGNGYVDFAVWGPLFRRTGERDMRRFKVLFFEGPRVSRTQLIENPERDHLWLYPARTAPDQFGSPTSALPGLMQSGEGGPSYYYVFDPGTQLLKRYETVSEFR